MSDQAEGNRVLLDTHILIHFAHGDLTTVERSLLKKKQFVISNIVLWEIAKLNQRGRVSLDVRHPKMVSLLRRIQLLPITAEIAARSCMLDFNSDPADELIAATSICHDIPLVTRDTKIRASEIVNTL